MPRPTSPTPAAAHGPQRARERSGRSTDAGHRLDVSTRRWLCAAHGHCDRRGRCRSRPASASCRSCGVPAWSSRRWTGARSTTSALLRSGFAHPQTSVSASADGFATCAANSTHAGRAPFWLIPARVRNPGSCASGSAAAARLREDRSADRVASTSTRVEDGMHRSAVDEHGRPLARADCGAAPAARPQPMPAGAACTRVVRGRSRLRIVAAIAAAIPSPRAVSSASCFMKPRGSMPTVFAACRAQLPAGPDTDALLRATARLRRCGPRAAGPRAAMTRWRDPGLLAPAIQTSTASARA